MLGMKVLGIIDEYMNDYGGLALFIETRPIQNVGIVQILKGKVQSVFSDKNAYLLSNNILIWKQ